MTRRIGIFGGMFDPVHDGHIAAGRHAVDLLELDRLLLIPCKLPNHRGPPSAAGRHRLAMLELATAADPKIEVDRVELDSEGVSYTVETLTRLRSRFPGAALVLVLGLDAFLGLPEWREPEKLFALANFLVIARQNLPMDYHMAGRFGGAMADNPRQMFRSGPGRVLLSREQGIDASSTSVRKQLAGVRKQVAVCGAAPLPAAVRAYIGEHGLYGVGKQ